MSSKAAIVVGAGKGMGAAIARTLSTEGYDLALMSNGGGAETLAAELGGAALTGSVTSEKDLAQLVELCMDRYGRIDAVANSTGHPPKGPLLDLTAEHWHQGLDLVLLNVVRMCQLVTPIMKKAGGGAIVNISTFAAYEPDASFPISASLRAALGGFTKLYSNEYAPLGIRMNNILPGFIDSYPESQEIVSRIPAGRYGSVDEIGQTAAFLLSPAAAYITGQNIRVDGGITRSV